MEKNFHHKCSATDPMAQAVPEDYVCPNCGSPVEIWSDEEKAKCLSCGNFVKRAEAKLKS